MIIDESHENFEEMRLYNDVMGIALAVWANAGDCPVFRHMDKALDNFNIGAMEIIRSAFETLPEALRADIMADRRSENTDAAIDRLALYISRMGANRKAAGA